MMSPLARIAVPSSPHKATATLTPSSGEQTARVFAAAQSRAAQGPGSERPTRGASLWREGFPGFGGGPPLTGLCLHKAWGRLPGLKGTESAVRTPAMSAGDMSSEGDTRPHRGLSWGAQCWEGPGPGEPRTAAPRVRTLVVPPEDECTPVSVSARVNPCTCVACASALRIVCTCHGGGMGPAEAHLLGPMCMHELLCRVRCVPLCNVYGDGRVHTREPRGGLSRSAGAACPCRGRPPGHLTARAWRVPGRPPSQAWTVVPHVPPGSEWPRSVPLASAPGCPRTSRRRASGSPAGASRTAGRGDTGTGTRLGKGRGRVWAMPAAEGGG